MSVSSLDKGKGRELPTSYQTSSRSGTSSASGSDSESDSDRSSDESSSDEEITQEYLDSLLEKARQNAARSLHSKSGSQDDFADGDEVIRLNTDEDEEEQKPLPPLDPGSLPMTYIDVGDSSQAGPSKVRDLDVEQAEKSTSKLKAPDVSRPVPELSESGKLLTKKEKKAQKNKTAGPGWFDLPAPAEADLPKLYREVEALRLRNQLDPKRFYRKEEGEGKGVKGLPKHFAVRLHTFLFTNNSSHTANCRLVLLFRNPRHLVQQVGITSVAVIGNERWWMSLWTMPRQRATQRRSSKSCRRLGAPGVEGRWQQRGGSRNGSGMSSLYVILLSSLCAHDVFIHAQRMSWSSAGDV
ncbi:unnamed protein product [Somion occarium]|uniref:Fcf2 pre-rRNA processing C-terminal domain-containing protein n=1 Tax=Somion occarium TaxID=3059160 RepID=A0ABP1DY92_9APHY